MSMFTSAASTIGETVKPPNSQTPYKELTVTIGQTVQITAQRDFQTKEIKRTKNGQVADQWVVDVTTADGTEGRMFIDKFALKQAIGRAFVQAGIEQFHAGDELTIVFEGQERLPSGFNANKYSAKVKHNGGRPIQEENRIEADENQARDEVRNAYGAASDANPWGNTAPSNWAP